MWGGAARGTQRATPAPSGHHDHCAAGGCRPRLQVPRTVRYAAAADAQAAASSTAAGWAGVPGSATNKQSESCMIVLLRTNVRGGRSDTRADGGEATVLFYLKIVAGCFGRIPRKENRRRSDLLGDSNLQAIAATLL